MRAIASEAIRAIHRGSNTILRSASLVVTDKKWAAPLSAMALGFGLFVGVAIGPGAPGSLATGAQQILEIPDLGGASSDEGRDEGGTAPAAQLAGPSGAEASTPPLTLESSAPPLEANEPEPIAEDPAGKPTKPGPKEPGPVGAQTFNGVVVHSNSAAGSYSMAISGGELIAVHAPKLPSPGTKLSLPLRRLANGTFAEAGNFTPKKGRVAKATFSGIVTFADPTPAAPAYTVSGRGASVLVRVSPDPTGAAPQLPAPGSFVTVTAGIKKPQPSPLPGESQSAPASDALSATACTADPALPQQAPIKPGAALWQRQVKVDGPPSTYADFAGIVEAVCPDSGQLLISADDIRESQRDLSFSVPAEIDMAKLKIGQSVVATATIGADGTLALNGLASDERTRGADDAEATQGDLARS